MYVLGFSGLDNSIRFKKRNWPTLSTREYRIAQGLDSAAALVGKAGVHAASAEERFSGEKGTGAFPIDAINFCLQAAGITLRDVDYVAHSFAYESFPDLYRYSTFTRQQFAEVFAREAQLRNLERHFGSNSWDERLVRVPHHLAHAASTYFLSGFPTALILIADAMGEAHSTTVAVGEGNQIRILRQIPGLHSLGILYGVVTLYLGFFMSFDEGKVMGLAPYGDRRRYYSRFAEFVHFKSDGTFLIPLLIHNRTLEEKETYRGTIRLLSELFGPPRQPGEPLSQHHADIAAALQAILEACLLHTLRYFRSETGQERLCMAGGVALNCTANSTIHRSRLFKEMFVQPAAGDDGSALGAALYVRHHQRPDERFESMSLPAWGPHYKNQRIEEILTTCSSCVFQAFTSFDRLLDEIAMRLARREVVAWFQGPMEFGPRALGHRSILADPRDPGMRDYLNDAIKQREGFRPFAPAVTIEHAGEYFDIRAGDEHLYRYMLFVAQVRATYQKQLGAVTHVDGTARVQVVSERDNQRFWALLRRFGQVTGIPILLNTSFNLRGQPIVRSPEQALDTFLSSNIDALVIEDYLVTRNS